MKFKIGDKVRIIKNTGDEFDKIEIGDIGEVVDICERDTYPIYIKTNNHSDYGFKEDELELVGREKEMKSFIEVIDDIREGEVWECKSCSIEKSCDSIYLDGIGYNAVFTDDYKGFKLKKKKYSFKEAFEAFEKDENNVIQSCVTGMEYSQSYDYIKCHIKIEEIRGKWCIYNRLKDEF